MYNFIFGNSNNDYFEVQRFMEAYDNPDASPEDKELVKKILNRTEVWATNENGYRVKLNDE